MRAYWAKILLGAMVVFAVGFGVVHLARGAIERKRSVFDSADPISIPLAFIPFTLDGQKVGTFRRLTILRDAPKVVARFDVRVQLEDGPPPSDLASCRLTTVEQGRFDIERGFVCLPAEPVDSALVEFGVVRFVGPDQTETLVPLLLDSTVVGEIRRSEHGIMEARRAISVEEGVAARAHARKMAEEARRRIDSIREAVPPRSP